MQLTSLAVSLALVAVVGLVRGSQGLECYSCSGEGCEDEFSTEGQTKVTNVVGGALAPALQNLQDIFNDRRKRAAAASSDLLTSLRSRRSLFDCKTCIKAKLEDGSVTRSCLNDAREDECQEKDGAEVCVCSEDLCNSATLSRLTTYTQLIGALVATLCVARLLH